MNLTKKYISLYCDKGKVNDIMFYETHISDNYTITNKSENIIVENLTNDITITLPDISDELINTNWRIVRNDNSSYKVYISLNNPSDSLFGEQFHTLMLKELGSGIEIYCNESNLYTYAKYDGLSLQEYIPVVITASADVNGTQLIMIGNVDNMGTNNSVDVYFRYREEGTSIWTNTISQTMTTTGNFNDNVTILTGTKYEVQAVLKDKKNILYYGDIILSSVWIDLRLNGDTFTDGNGAGNDIRYKSGMSMTRDVDGMYFNGANPWSSWVKFESLAWTRGENKTLQWIFTRPSSSMMIGIGSDATDENSSKQYRQAECEAYFSNSNTLYGLYGNNGIIGNSVSQQVNTSISGGSGVFKIKFTNDSTINSGVFSIYELPSADENDWGDESNLINSFTNTLIGADELNIMPFIIPRNGGSQRFIALKIS